MSAPPHLGALRNSTLLVPSPITLCQSHNCPSAHCTRPPSPARRLAQAAAVVGVLPELKLELYSLKRQEKAFAGLVATVKDTLFKHDDEQVGRGGGRGGGTASRCERLGGQGMCPAEVASWRESSQWMVPRDQRERTGGTRGEMRHDRASSSCVRLLSSQCSPARKGCLAHNAESVPVFSRRRQRWSACARWRCAPRRAPTPSRLV